jgi:hypothetical protein
MPLLIAVAALAAMPGCRASISAEAAETDGGRGGQSEGSQTSTGTSTSTSMDAVEQPDDGASQPPPSGPTASLALPSVTPEEITEGMTLEDLVRLATTDSPRVAESYQRALQAQEDWHQAVQLYEQSTATGKELSALAETANAAAHALESATMDHLDVTADQVAETQSAYFELLKARRSASGYGALTAFLDDVGEHLRRAIDLGEVSTADAALLAVSKQTVLRDAADAEAKVTSAMAALMRAAGGTPTPPFPVVADYPVPDLTGWQVPELNDGVVAQAVDRSFAIASHLHSRDAAIARARAGSLLLALDLAKTPPLTDREHAIAREEAVAAEMDLKAVDETGAIRQALTDADARLLALSAVAHANAALQGELAAAFRAILAQVEAGQADLLSLVSLAEDYVAASVAMEVDGVSYLQTVAEIDRHLLSGLYPQLPPFGGTP